MRNTLQSNETLKLQLNKAHAERVTDPDVLVKLQDTEQELQELRQELEQCKQQHQVYS